MSLPEPATAPPPARRCASFSRLRISRVPLRAPAAGAWRTALLQQGFGDVGRVARALPFLRGIFSMDGDSVRAQAARFPFEQLRQDPDAASALFAAQAAATNRLTHLRGLRDETRALRRMLEAERALRSARGRSSSRTP